MTWLLILVVSLAAGRSAAVGGLGRQGEFRSLVLESKVTDNLALLFAQFDTELVLCLEGEWRGPDLHITDFRMPHILTSESGRVQASACDMGRNAIGTWHNHPTPRSGISTVNSQRLVRNCYLSRTDMTDFRRRKDAVVTIVSCAPDVYAYWKRGDVMTAGVDAAMLPPPEGQLVHAELRDGAAAGLIQARER
jgi:hypothetical protein